MTEADFVDECEPAAVRNRCHRPSLDVENRQPNADRVRFRHVSPANAASPRAGLESSVDLFCAALNRYGDDAGAVGSRPGQPGFDLLGRRTARGDLSRSAKNLSKTDQRTT